MKFDDAMRHLGETTERGEGYRAKCPAHNGESLDSLSIANFDGEAALHCFSGCTYKEVADALDGGLSSSQVQTVPTPPPAYENTTPTKPKKPSTITAVYRYDDEEGVTLFEKIRLEPKSFRVRIPSGNGNYEYKLNGTRRILYNLQEVIAHDTVFIVEGEKDADRLISLGLVATCNFDGASTGKAKPKWMADYNPFFKNKDVYIIPDNDEAGDAHATHIKHQLSDIAASAKIIELPNLKKAGDVSDWLDDGNTIDDLMGLVYYVPTQYDLKDVPKIISGQELIDKEFAPIEFLVDGLIARGMLNLIGGRPKSGKSWFMLQMAMCIDSGLPFLDRPTKRCRILYLALEDGERRINQRMKTLNWKPENVDFMFTIEPLSTGEAYPGMEQLRKLVPYYDIIFIDTLIATLNGSTNENDNVQMGNVLNGLAALAHESNTCIGLVHHTGKSKKDDPFDSFRGASAIRGAYDLGMILDRTVDEKEAMLHIESRDWDVSDMTLELIGGSVGWKSLGGVSEIHSIRAGRKTLQVFDEFGDGLTTDEYAGFCEVTKQAASKSLKTAERKGLVLCKYEKHGDSNRSIQTWYRKTG